MGDRFARAERPQYETLSFHTVEQPAVREGCGRRAADLLQQISDYSHHVLLHLKCDREPLQDHVESGKAPFIRCMAQGQPEHSAQERIREPLSERPEATKPRTLDAQMRQRTDCEHVEPGLARFPHGGRVLLNRRCACGRSKDACSSSFIHPAVPAGCRARSPWSPPTRGTEESRRRLPSPPRAAGRHGLRPQLKRRRESKAW